MLRANRHRRIITAVRRARRPITAQTLADKLEVTVRTIYRDVAALVDDGVPIRGEAGIGYVLAPGYDLPPLMFTADELEALMLGMRMVASRADESTAASATAVIDKVKGVLPPSLHPVLVDAPLFPIPVAKRWQKRDQVDLSGLRDALRNGKKLAIEYADEAGRKSSRIIWPLSIGYFDTRRLVVAWCELRNDFRHFRTDRIIDAIRLSESLPQERQKLLARWRIQQAAEWKRKEEERSCVERPTRDRPSLRE